MYQKHLKIILSSNMKHLINLLILFIILISLQSSSGIKSIPASSKEFDYSIKVVGIVDGDTFKGLTKDNIEIRYRIHGIDAPERYQPFSDKSKQYLSDLIFNKKVGIIVQKESDRYGCPVVWVFTPEGNDVSAELIKAGMAWHSKAYSDDAHYAKLEIEARDRKIGLWSDASPIAPWEFRRK